MPLLTELKRRNVIKVAIAYLAVAWLLLQLMSVIEQPLNMPEGSINFFIGLAIFGFPVALILTWALELTPDGLVKNQVDSTSSIANIQFGVLMAVIVIAALAITLLSGNASNDFVASPVVEKVIETAQSNTSSNQTADDLPSIAVLPFVNMSGNADNEYFSDGISEELLHGLANLGGLRVAARTSSFYFKGKGEDVRSMGQKLSVGTVLEGSVRRAGDRVRITAQLINVADGYHLWSDTFDRKLDDIFAVQDEIALAIVNALKVKLGVEQTAQNNTLLNIGTTNNDAYAAYLKGKYAYHRSSADFEDAIAYFKEAVAFDPNFGDAWANLASSYEWQRVFTSDIEEISPLLTEAADKALALDPHNTIANALKGTLLLQEKYDWQASHHYFAKALRSKTDYPDVASHYTNVIVNALGQTERTLTLLRQAERQDPYHARVKLSQAFTLSLAKRWPELLVKSIEMRQLAPDAYDPHFLCRAYLELDLLDELEALFSQDNGLAKNSPHCQVFRAIGLGTPAERKQLEASLRQTDESYDQWSAAALAYLALMQGDVDLTIEVFEQACEKKAAFCTAARILPLNTGDLWDELWADPRYMALLKRINLDDASVAEYERTIDF